jgi:ribonuclease J
MTTHPDDELVFLPLGGSNEIGMNFNLYGFGPPHARKWIVVDLGVTFGDQTTPGVEVILPDPTFIEEHAKDILGIVLTHAHEDHIGAVPWLWERLKAPLYATPFTAFLLREKLREADLLGEARITEVPLSGTIKLGPFEITLITLTHSIPEPNGPATGRSTPTRSPARSPTTTPSTAWATKASWPWSATRPTSSSTARPARKRPCARCWPS